MQNNVVAIDLDSCLSMFLERSLEVFNEEYGTNYTTEDITSWDMSECLKCDPNDLYKLWTPSFFLSVEPRDYLKQMFIDLREMGYNPVVVTSYSSNNCLAKTQWLGKYAGLCENDIIFCRNKYLINADFRLDDRIRNFFDDKMEVIENCEHIVFSQQYNIDGIEGDCELKDYYRVENLRDFVSIMRNFKIEM